MSHRKREEFAPSSFCQKPWGSLQITVLPRGFLQEHLLEFDRLVNLWCSGLISPKAILVLLQNFHNFRFYAVELQTIVDVGRYGLYLGSSWQFRGHLSWEKGWCSPCLSVYYVLVVCGVAVNIFTSLYIYLCNCILRDRVAAILFLDTKLLC